MKRRGQGGYTKHLTPVQVRSFNFKGLEAENWQEKQVIKGNHRPISALTSKNAAKLYKNDIIQQTMKKQEILNAGRPYTSQGCERVWTANCPEKGTNYIGKGDMGSKRPTSSRGSHRTKVKGRLAEKCKIIGKVGRMQKNPRREGRENERGSMEFGSPPISIIIRPQTEGESRNGNKLRGILKGDVVGTGDGDGVNEKSTKSTKSIKNINHMESIGNRSIGSIYAIGGSIKGKSIDTSVTEEREYINDIICCGEEKKSLKINIYNPKNLSKLSLKGNTSNVNLWEGALSKTGDESESLERMMNTVPVTFKEKVVVEDGNREYIQVTEACVQPSESPVNHMQPLQPISYPLPISNNLPRGKSPMRRSSSPEYVGGSKSSQIGSYLMQSKLNKEVKNLKGQAGREKEEHPKGVSASYTHFSHIYKSSSTQDVPGGGIGAGGRGGGLGISGVSSLVSNNNNLMQKKNTISRNELFFASTHITSINSNSNVPRPPTTGSLIDHKHKTPISPRGGGDPRNRCKGGNDNQPLRHRASLLPISKNRRSLTKLQGEIQGTNTRPLMTTIKTQTTNPFTVWEQYTNSANNAQKFMEKAYKTTDKLDFAPFARQFTQNEKEFNATEKKRIFSKNYYIERRRFVKNPPKIGSSKKLERDIMFNSKGTELKPGVYNVADYLRSAAVNSGANYSKNVQRINYVNQLRFNPDIGRLLQGDRNPLSKMNNSIIQPKNIELIAATLILDSPRARKNPLEVKKNMLIHSNTENCFFVYGDKMKEEKSMVEELPVLKPDDFIPKSLLHPNKEIFQFKPQTRQLYIQISDY